MDKIISTVQYHDYIIIFCESGAIYRMAFTTFPKDTDDFIMIKIGNWLPRL